jgi:hypothetical protein
MPEESLTVTLSRDELSLIVTGLRGLETISDQMMLHAARTPMGSEAAGFMMRDVSALANKLVAVAPFVGWTAREWMRPK